MGLFDRFKKKPEVKEEKPKVEKPKAKTAKEIATEKGEPYVNILSMDVNPDDINSGAFELDWNDKFIANLARAGYQGKTDSDMVDQWFQNVCRNVVLETYEQFEAINNSARFTQSRDIGDGRREVS
jgi:hypothetical protein